MKLFFDARWIRTDFHDGISRYTTELANALAMQHPVTFLICDKAQLALLPPNSEHIMIHPQDSLREPFTAIILNKYNPDIVISPMQTMGSLGRRFKLVLTLHDLIYYKHRLPPPQAKGFLLRLGWRLYHLTYIPQRLTLNRADLVATVSETSKKEMLDAHLTKHPIVVIPNAARDLSTYLKQPPSTSNTPPKNLVYMGAFLPYKNVETLITMMQYLPDRTLHLCSRISPKRKAALKRLVGPSSHVVFHDGVSDEEYARLLADDAILVSASKAEGYGLPLAEALYLGIPTVVSDMPIFHEVAGDGALYADPGNPGEFAKAVLQLDGAATRQTLTKAGQKHIKQFNWDASAGKLLAACKTLID